MAQQEQHAALSEALAGVQKGHDRIEVGRERVNKGLNVLNLDT